MWWIRGKQTCGLPPHIVFSCRPPGPTCPTWAFPASALQSNAKIVLIATVLQNAAIGRGWRDVESFVNIFPIHHFISSPRHDNNSFQCRGVDKTRFRWK